MVIDMLMSLAFEKNIDFNIHIMTYGRAKKELQSRRLDLIGLTPYQLETDDFYQYSVELNWHINTHVDFYSLDKSYFDIEKLPNGSIGTLIGNAEFFSEIVSVPTIKFVEVSSLQQLVKMLEMGIVPASLAVSNTAEGLRLKELLVFWLNGTGHFNKRQLTVKY